jgi:hypothetical protein
MAGKENWSSYFPSPVFCAFTTQPGSAPVLSCALTLVRPIANMQITTKSRWKRAMMLRVFIKNEFPYKELAFLITDNYLLS